MSSMCSDIMIPKTVNEINSEWFEKIFQAYSNSPVKVKECQLKSSIGKGENFCTNVNRFCISILMDEKLKNFNLVIKTSAESAGGKDFTERLRLFERECYAYSHYHPYLKRRFDSQPGPLYYFGKADKGDGVIVLQDLNHDGYVMRNRFDPMTWDEASAVIKCLANYHAHGHLALTWGEAIDFDTVLKIERHVQVKKMVDEIVTSVERIVTSHLSDYAEYKDSILKALQFHPYPFLFKHNGGSQFLTIVHGDCWTNNMLFKYSSSKDHQVKLIDWQFPLTSPGMIDLCYFLYSSTTPQFRKQYIRDLLSLYLENYTQELRKYITVSDEVYSLDNLVAEFEDYKCYRFWMAVFFTRTVYDETASKTSGLNSEDFVFIDCSQDCSSEGKSRLADIFDEFIFNGLITSNSTS